MPSNKKYLLKSNWAKASKVTAAILGGLIVVSLLHILFGLLISAELMVLCIWFTFPIAWAFIITVVYWIKGPAKVWGLITLISLVAVPIIYYLKS